jgi:hypothetical protein
MRVPDQNKIIGTQVFWQILLLMSHVNAETRQLEVKEHRDILRPLFIVVTTYSIDRSDLSS